MTYDNPEHADNPVAEEEPVSDEQPEVEEQPDAEDEQKAGSADPSKRFREMDVSEEEQREIAEERERRLDPDNRPEGAEVDNTQRTVVDGGFKD